MLFRTFGISLGSYGGVNVAICSTKGAGRGSSDVSEAEFLVLFFLNEFKGDPSTLSKLGLDSQLRYIVSSKAC
jgi:hypothetical protein